MYKRLLHICFFLFPMLVCVGQSKTSGKMIKIVNAESLSFDREKNNAKILRGNVICEHDGAMLYCDTALIFDEEIRMEASGHILITKGDSIRVTGDKLQYDGKSKMATLLGNVKCVEKDMTLTTGILTFDVGRSIANYYNGGTLVNKQNTLVSKNGHYYSATKEAAFHYDVKLTNPQYTMDSDTLRYKVNTKTSYFLGPSVISSKSDYIFCENGWYDTNKEKAQFSKHALLVTAQQKLRGDSLVYDRTTKTGKAFRNVSLIDTSRKSVIYGHYIEYHEASSEAFVTKNAIYARLIEGDSLFIGADTLYHRDLDSVNNFLNAYHHVRVYKSDLQAICDSATLHTKDSLLQLFKDPIMWGKRSQASARVISVDIGKSSIKGFLMDGKAFFIQQPDSFNTKRFNQLSGKQLQGYLERDSLRKAVIRGNSEILYYPKNKEKAMGLNKTTTSDITIWFKNGEADRIRLNPKSEGTIDPIKEVSDETARLKGFNWQYAKRPASRSDLHPPLLKK